MSKTAQQRWDAAKVSYQYCGVCGHVPKGNEEDPNYRSNRAPLRWWDCDDGWKIGALCHGCACGMETKTFGKQDAILDAQPKPGDYAYKRTNGVADDVNTDEDEMEALLDA